MNLLVTTGPQVLDDTWARRLKVARRDIGEGMTMAEARRSARRSTWVLFRPTGRP